MAWFSKLTDVMERSRISAPLKMMPLVGIKIHNLKAYLFQDCSFALKIFWDEACSWYSVFSLIQLIRKYHKKTSWGISALLLWIETGNAEASANEIWLKKENAQQQKKSLSRFKYKLSDSYSQSALLVSSSQQSTFLESVASIEKLFCSMHYASHTGRNQKWSYQVVPRTTAPKTSSIRGAGSF